MTKAVSLLALGLCLLSPAAVPAAARPIPSMPGPITFTAQTRLPLVDVTAIAGGGWHSCAVMSGRMPGWGANWNGRVGDGITEQRSVGVQVVGLDSGFVPSPAEGTFPAR